MAGETDLAAADIVKTPSMRKGYLAVAKASSKLADGLDRMSD
jgi:hypothetical protein